MVIKWLKDNKINVLVWQSQSPDVKQEPQQTIVKHFDTVQIYVPKKVWSHLTVKKKKKKVHLSLFGVCKPLV